MSHQGNIIPAGPTHIELKIDMEAPNLPLWLAEKRWRALDNPIFDVDVAGKKITAVHQVEGINYDHSEAAEGELVWKCEFCNAYSKTKRVVEAHEKTCSQRDNE